MLLKLISLICVINVSILRPLDCKTMIELNQTSAFLSILSLLTDLKVEVARQGKVLDELKQCQQCLIRPGEGSCGELTIHSMKSGIYELSLPHFSSEPIRVACDLETQGGGWLIILRRMDGSVNFNRDWSAYKRGFGDLDGEFFVGLNKLHALTGERNQELIVLLEDYDGNARQEIYEKFSIGNEQELYALNTLGIASGTAGDSMIYHHGMKFSTFDRDNDPDTNRNCAETFNGGWWYKTCHESHLTGVYKNNEYGKGINWYSFRGHTYSLKRAVMMIRPRK